MNLFDSIGLKSDPFSTSPNVDLFYPAAQHRQCLEGLELAIRMRRGLSVVRGGIGVGKTTVSRKLIQNFKMESDDFDFYLILDPKFESEIILLQHIIELFGVDETGNSVQACRNIIENFLLKVGVEQGKVLVLIIDEGQNLPGEMLDVFRTLLNFETDDFKLLQLIIFGQPEMGNMIHKYPNFEDRISFDFEIGPTAIEDMRGMIDNDQSIDPRDFAPYTYPNLRDLKKLRYQSVCLGSFIPWDTKTQSQLIMDELGWEGDEVEGMPPKIYDYEKIECHMQGVRDYIKYIGEMGEWLKPAVC